MNLDHKLHEAFEKHLSQGPRSLSAEEWKLYRAQRFIIESEVGGLTGFLYSILPDHHEIKETIASLGSLGLHDYCHILTEAYGLFRDYKEPIEESTWEEQCLIYDSNGKLGLLEDELLRVQS